MGWVNVFEGKPPSRLERLDWIGAGGELITDGDVWGGPLPAAGVGGGEKGCWGGVGAGGGGEDSPAG